MLLFIEMCTRATSDINSIIITIMNKIITVIVVFSKIVTVCHFMPSKWASTDLLRKQMVMKW